MKNFILIVGVVLIALGCSEVPYELPPKFISNSGKTVLIEDLTGVDCGNCPKVARKLETIAAEDGVKGKVIIVASHGILLAAPLEDKSKYDFRNDDAIFLENFFNPSGKPAVTVSRVQFPDLQKLTIPGVNLTLQSKIEEILALPQELSIEVGSTYDSETRELKISAGVTALKDLSGDFYISTMITESHIIDYQKDSEFSIVNPEYEHNHVLRDILTEPLGSPLTNSMTEGELVSRTWSYILPTEQGLWIPDNLEIVVSVSNHSDGKYDVLQAAQAKVLE